MSGDLNIDWIRERVRRKEYLITWHADQERRDDDLDIADMEEALLTGLIIEDYPEDKRGHSCLLYGRSANCDVHVVCGRNASGWPVLITVYVPGPPKWITSTKRRPKS